MDHLCTCENLYTIHMYGKNSVNDSETIRQIALNSHNCGTITSQNNNTKWIMSDISTTYDPKCVSLSYNSVSKSGWVISSGEISGLRHVVYFTDNKYIMCKNICKEILLLSSIPIVGIVAFIFTIMVIAQ